MEDVNGARMLQACISRVETWQRSRGHSEGQRSRATKVFSRVVHRVASRFYKAEFKCYLGMCLTTDYKTALLGHYSSAWAWW